MERRTCTTLRFIRVGTLPAHSPHALQPRAGHLSGEGIPRAIVGDRVLHVCLAACILEERITQIMLKRPPTPVRIARRTCLQLPSWSASYQVAFLKLGRACCTCARREVISPDDAVNATPATVPLVFLPSVCGARRDMFVGR